MRCFRRLLKYIRKSGGIGVFVKQSLSSLVSFVESYSDYVLWLSISKKPIILMKILL